MMINVYFRIYPTEPNYPAYFAAAFCAYAHKSIHKFSFLLFHFSLIIPPQHPSRWTFSIHNEPTYIVTFLFFQHVIQIIEDVLELCNE